MKRKVKVTDALNTFYDRYENQQTITSYRGDLDHMATYFAGVSHIGGLMCYVSSMDVQNYVGVLRKRKISGQGKYSPATINKKIKSIKAFFRWAHRSKIIDENPADEIRNARIPDDARKMRVITMEELDRLLVYCSFPSRLRERALVMFLGDTGVRRGGCANLRTSDINFRTGTVTVTEKNDKTHDVYPGDACIHAIKLWIERRDIYDPESYIFSRDGRFLSGSGIAQFFRRTCIAAGIGSRGPHEMRRFKITQMLDAGTNPRTVQKAVNHSDIRQTLKYVKKTSEDVREALRQFAVSERIERPRLSVMPPPSLKAEEG